MFKFENVVAENVRIANIHIRLIDHHKADMRKNCEAILCGSCSQLATPRTHSDNGSARANAALSCIARLPSTTQCLFNQQTWQPSAAAAANSQGLGHTRTPAAPVRKNRKAILGGCCSQPATPRTHSDPGSAQFPQYVCLYGFSGFGERTTKSDSTSSFRDTSSK